MFVYRPVPEETPIQELTASRPALAKTDSDGKAIFEDLLPGVYAISVLSLRDGPLISPQDNPWAPAPTFTIAQPDERVALVVEVWRGTPMSARIVVDNDAPPPASVELRSLDGLPGRTIPLRNGKWLGPLVPGRWEARFQFPAGYLLSDLVLNGESRPGFVLRFDTREDPRPQDLTAYLNARSLIHGTLRGEGGRCPVRVVATLEAPAGDWLAAANERGGSEFQRVVGLSDEPCVYKMWLPEGGWLVRPEGDIAGSDPEEVRVDIALGERREIDFDLLTNEQKERGEDLLVRVLSPDGKTVEGATVEAYRDDASESEGDSASDSEAAESGPPLATDVTGRFFWTDARLAGLAAGSYRIVAGHPDFLEGEATVAHDPRAKKPTVVDVKLRAGGVIHARAVDGDGTAVGEVELRVTRVGDPPSGGLASELVRASKMSRTVRADATGHVWVRGLPAGTYRLAATLAGAKTAAHFVRLRAGSAPPAASAEVELSEGRTTEVELVVLPAASLTGTLRCSDGGSLAPALGVRVFDAATPAKPWTDPDLREGSLLAVDDLRLGGKLLDEFDAGPLETGTHRLAVRPAGHDYWSWPTDALTPETAMPFPVTELSPRKIGVATIECGPLVMLVPRIASGQATPDLRLGRVVVDPVIEATEEATSPEGEPQEKEPLPHRTEASPDRVFVRGLPPEKVNLRLRLEHPYLIPSEREIARDGLDLLRGRLSEIQVPFDAVGGLLEVRGTGAAARRTSLQGKAEGTVPVSQGTVPELIRPVIGGVASFPGTPAGRWNVELCADPECRSVLKTWDGVVVEAARTVTLTASDSIVPAAAR